MRRLIPVLATCALLTGLSVPARAGTPPSKTAKPAAQTGKTAPPAGVTAVPPGKSATPPATAVAPPAAPAPANQPLRPNLWELKSGTLSVSYATSGIDGKPHFTYKEGDTTVAASGADIRLQETEIGTLVTVTTRRTVDSGSTAFSLLIPLVNMENASSVVSVNVVGVTTHHRFSPVPAFNRGQVQLGSSVMLNGTARRVTF